MSGIGLLNRWRPLECESGIVTAISYIQCDSLALSLKEGSTESVPVECEFNLNFISSVCDIRALTNHQVIRFQEETCYMETLILFCPLDLSH